MKKYLLIVSAFVFALTTANSQISITTADVPEAGKIIIEAIDTSVNTVLLSSGANLAWDYSTWQNQRQDTTSFVNPQSLLGYSDFPGSNLAINGANLGGNGGDIFLSNSSNELDILGVYGDLGVGAMAVPFNPAQKFIGFPANYLNTFNGTSSFEFQSGDTIKFVHTIIYTSEMDGWGTITTPAFTNLNSLRQKYTEIGIDSVFYKVLGNWQPVSSSKDTSINYRWWSNSFKGSVAEVTTDQNGVIKKVKYHLTTQVGINENSISKNQVKLFPNPSNEIISFSGLQCPARLIILDASGRVLENTFLKKSNSIFSISNYENGIYIYQVYDQNGEMSGFGKFSVVK